MDFTLELFYKDSCVFLNDILLYLANLINYIFLFVQIIKLALFRYWFTILLREIFIRFIRFIRFILLLLEDKLMLYIFCNLSSVYKDAKDSCRVRYLNYLLRITLPMVLIGLQVILCQIFYEFIWFVLSRSKGFELTLIFFIILSFRDYIMFILLSDISFVIFPIYLLT